jgi:Cu-processing system permease protein
VSEANGRRPDWNQVLAVAEKEFFDNVRSKWIVIITVLFVVLTLLFSIVASLQAGQGARFGGFRATGLGMVSMVGILIPMLALMLSYATIAGERENGSLQLLLTMPVTRLEIVLGKFAGLGAVLTFALLLGLGTSAAVIVAMAGADGLDAFFVFLAGAILMALAFLAVGIFFSTLVARRSTALGLAVFLWFFFNLIYDTVLVGVFFATGGSLAGASGPGGALTFHFPDWYYAAQMFNPGDAFGLLAERALGGSSAVGLTVPMPGFVTVGACFGLISLWVAVPLTLAHVRFSRADL